MTEEEKLYGAKQIARMLAVDPKLLRKFFRTKYWIGDAVGRGNHYVFYESELQAVMLAFKIWDERRQRRT